MTAEQAIARSSSHDEIVTLDYDAAAVETLLVECDDLVDGNTCLEFYGTDDGSEWRVHVRHEASK